MQVFETAYPVPHSIVISSSQLLSLRGGPSAMGMLKKLIIGRENGLRAGVRRAIFGGGKDADTTPNSAYSSPTYTAAVAPVEKPLEPPRDVTPPEGFEVVMHKDALAPGDVVELIAGGMAIAVCNVDGEFFAMDNACPHAEGPLGEGSMDGSVLTCPYHGWSFDVKTGACQTNADTSLTTYAVAVEGDAVCVRL
jgi:nitrite reductase (NADH) small subunit